MKSSPADLPDQVVCCLHPTRLFCVGTSFRAQVAELECLMSPASGGCASAATGTILVYALLPGSAAKPVEVRIPVFVSCIDTVPGWSGSTFGAGKRPRDKRAAPAALVDPALWQGYALRIEVVVAGCR